MARTVHYFDWQDLIGLIPESDAIEALDDDEDGVAVMWFDSLADLEALLDVPRRLGYTVEYRRAERPAAFSVG